MHSRKERYHLSFIGYSDKERNLVKKKQQKNHTVMDSSECQ